MKEKYYVSPQPTTTTCISGESITINSTKPNKLAKDIFVTGLSTEQPKLTEKEILKKFEEDWAISLNDEYYLLLINDCDTRLEIDKREKRYECYYCRQFSADKNRYSSFIDFKTHQLLTELFKCWGWI